MFRPLPRSRRCCDQPAPPAAGQPGRSHSSRLGVRVRPPPGLTACYRPAAPKAQTDFDTAHGASEGTGGQQRSCGCVKPIAVDTRIHFCNLSPSLYLLSLCEQQIAIPLEMHLIMNHQESLFHLSSYKSIISNSLAI